MSRSAKVLAAADVCRLLKHVKHHRNAERNHVIVLLSFKAGLRACEIAGVSWQMVLTPRGRVADHIDVDHRVAKKDSGRTIPLHSDLKRALIALHRLQGRPIDGPIVRSERGGHMTPRSIVNFFAEVYDRLNLRGCSSHSGRRTFITLASRALSKAGASLRDVQQLAGHRAMTCTQRYIDTDPVLKKRLVQLI